MDFLRLHGAVDFKKETGNHDFAALIIMSQGTFGIEVNNKVFPLNAASGARFFPGFTGRAFAR